MRKDFRRQKKNRYPRGRGPVPENRPKRRKKPPRHPPKRLHSRKVRLNTRIRHYQTRMTVETYRERTRPGCRLIIRGRPTFPGMSPPGAGNRSGYLTGSFSRILFLPFPTRYQRLPRLFRLRRAAPRAATEKIPVMVFAAVAIVTSHHHRRGSHYLPVSGRKSDRAGYRLSRRP